jgi:hypothetical protein
MVAPRDHISNLACFGFPALEATFMTSVFAFVRRCNPDGTSVTSFQNVATISEGGLEVGENLHLRTSSEEICPVTPKGYLTLTERVLRFFDAYNI